MRRRGQALRLRERKESDEDGADLGERLLVPRTAVRQRPRQHGQMPAQAALAHVPPAGPHGQPCSRAHCNLLQEKEEEEAMKPRSIR